VIGDGDFWQSGEEMSAQGPETEVASCELNVRLADPRIQRSAHSRFVQTSDRRATPTPQLERG